MRHLFYLYLYEIYHGFRFIYCAGELVKWVSTKFINTFPHLSAHVAIDSMIISQAGPYFYFSKLLRAHQLSF